MVASLVVSGLCLAFAGPLSADNISYTSPDPSKHHHYDNPAGPEAYGTEDTLNATGATGTSGTYSTYQAQGEGRIIRARSLLGMDVKNSQDQRLGEIRDVVVDRDSGRVNFVIMEKAERASGTPPNVAVPVNELKASGDMRTLLFDVDKNQIAQAR
jgi:sporulation protein YlmC with PRC-barrel domain